MIPVQRRTVKWLGSLLLGCALSSVALGVQAPPPGGSNWQITYDHTGSKMVLHCFDRLGAPGHQTLVPKDVDEIAGTGNTLTANFLSFSAGGTSYTPTPDMKPVNVMCSVDITFKTKTTVKWIGTGTAPATVKLIMNGNANSNYYNGGGVCVPSADGLGHASVDVNGQVWQGGAPPYGSYIPYGSSISSGHRYREFKVQNGQVVFNTTSTSSVSGFASFSTTVSFYVAETQWAVRVSSDRDPTFRRVVSGGNVYRIDNAYEDDGVTLKGGDSNAEGDAVATEANFLNGKQRDFASTFTEFVTGFSYLTTTGTISSTAALGASSSYPPPYAQVIAGYESIPDSPAKPLATFTVTGTVSDPSEVVSDTAQYTMRVHLLAEKETQIATFNTDYLYWSKDVPAFSGYNYAAHIPTKPLTKENGTFTDILWGYTVTQVEQATEGWEYTATTGSELTESIAKIIFNSTFKITKQLQVTETVGQDAKITIPIGCRCEVWRCSSGILQQWATSRWDDHGYKSDAIDYAILGYTANDKFLIRPMSAPIDLPHMSDGGTK